MGLFTEFQPKPPNHQENMIAQLFRAHGRFCASYQWEVIFALSILTILMITVDKSTTTPPPPVRHRNCQGWRDSCEGLEAEYVAVDVILMTVVRLSAVLYSCYQFSYLSKFGSRNILGESTHTKHASSAAFINIHLLAKSRYGHCSLNNHQSTATVCLFS